MIHVLALFYLLGCSAAPVEAVCDTNGSVCEGEDVLTYSLLQMQVRLEPVETLNLTSAKAGPLPVDHCTGNPTDGSQTSGTCSSVCAKNVDEQTGALSKLKWCWISGSAREGDWCWCGTEVDKEEVVPQIHRSQVHHETEIEKAERELKNAKEQYWNARGEHKQDKVALKDAESQISDDLKDVEDYAVVAKISEKHAEQYANKIQKIDQELERKVETLEFRTLMVTIVFSVFLCMALVGCFAFTFFCILGGRRSQSYDSSANAAEAHLNRLRAEAAARVTFPPDTAASLRSTAASIPESASAASGPPPICPNLVLHQTEAIFMVSLESLRRLTIGSLDVLGPSGRKLLQAAVSDTAEGRKVLALASCGAEEDPRVCIYAPFRPENTCFGKGERQSLEIYGRQGVFYGRLESAGGHTRAILHHGDSHNPTMFVDIGIRSDMRMTAVTVDGTYLGEAQLVEEQIEGGPAWRIKTKPGIDALLVTSCLLSLLVIGPWSSELSSHS